jgi:16S rRNA processing protein RimM
LKRADLVVLGRVLRSEGRDGRLKLRLTEKGPTEFVGRTVYLKRGSDLVACEVESLALDRNAYILKLKGIDTLEAADALAGREICAAEPDFRRLGADRYYDFQIIGSRVRTRAGAEVGTVASVLETGGPALLVVRRGDEDIYVPFTATICVEVDTEAREVVIDPPEGLLDLNEI